MTGKTLRASIYLAIFAVITLLLTYVLAVTIENGSVGNTVAYQAQFTDATGLLPGDDVRIAGVRVGQVQGVSVRADPRDASHRIALVRFNLARTIPLHRSVQAVLRYRNLVGQRYLDLQESPGSDAVFPRGATIPLAQTKPALDLTVLFDGFKPLFSALTPNDVNKVAYEVIRTLQGEGGTIDALLTSTASLSNSVADQDAAIGSLITNLSGVLGTVDDRDNQLKNLIDNLQALVTGLAGDRDAIAASLSHVNDLTTSTTRLLAAIRPELPTDLQQLSGLANTLGTTTTAVNGQQVNQLDEFLRRFPTKINAITRTATYGSWFNFYLCDADINLGGGANVKLHSTNTAICGAG